MSSKTFCSKPWKNLEINADGSFAPCCIWGDRLKDENNIEFNVNKNSFDEIYNSKHLKELRSNLLNNKRPESCSQCWQEEDNGIMSLRQKETHFNDYDQEQIRSLSIAFGNICNLRCRICGPWASSIWAKNELKKHSDEEKRNSFEFEILKKGQWPITSKVFWEDLEKYLPALSKISFYGGEPFLINQHFRLLEKFSNISDVSNIEIDYVTNGTILPNTDIIESWKKFKNVSLMVSIDNIFEKFEYERSRSDWDTLVKNLNKFDQLANETENISLSCNMTISVFNILDFKTIKKWMKENYPNMHINWSMLIVEERFCVKYLPQDIKAKIEESLFPHDTNDISSIIKFMNDGETDMGYFNELKTEIKRIDQFRREKLSDTHPELNDLLKIY